MRRRDHEKMRAGEEAARALDAASRRVGRFRYARFLPSRYDRWQMLYRLHAEVRDVAYADEAFDCLRRLRVRARAARRVCRVRVILRSYMVLPPRCRAIFAALFFAQFMIAWRRGDYASQAQCACL